MGLCGETDTERTRVVGWTSTLPLINPSSISTLTPVWGHKHKRLYGVSLPFLLFHLLDSLSLSHSLIFSLILFHTQMPYLTTSPAQCLSHALVLFNFQHPLDWHILSTLSISFLSCSWPLPLPLSLSLPSSFILLSQKHKHQHFSLLNIPQFYSYLAT